MACIRLLNRFLIVVTVGRMARRMLGEGDGGDPGGGTGVEGLDGVGDGLTGWTTGWRTGWIADY